MPAWTLSTGPSTRDALEGSIERMRLNALNRLAVEMTAQQVHVAAVGFPHQVEDVAGQRHSADHAVDGDIAQPARDQMVRRAERMRFSYRLNFGYFRDR
jgi:hypothetical protein